MIAPRPPAVRVALACTVALLAALLLCANALTGVARADSGVSWWGLDATVAPSLLPRNGAGHAGEAQIIVTATNLGDGEVRGGEEHIVLTDRLPAGVTATKALAVDLADGVKEKATCAGEQTVVCTFNGPLDNPPFTALTMKIVAHMEATTDPLVTSLPNAVSVQGGKTPTVSIDKPLRLQTTPGQQTPFGVQAYALTAETEDGSLDTQAGSHPFQLTTQLDLNQTLESAEQGSAYFPSAPALPRDLRFKLPPGLIADTTAMPRCTMVAFSTLERGASNLCPADTAIGVASVLINDPNLEHELTVQVPVFNLVPAAGEPARFGFEAEEAPVVLSSSLPAGGDYAAEVSTSDTTQAVQLLSSQVTIWGVPGDPRHDSARGWECLHDGEWEKAREPAPPCTPEQQSSPPAFLTLPTACTPLTTTVAGDSWPTGEPGNPGSPLAPESTEYTSPIALSGCNLLGFEPSLTVQPEAHAASTPSGLAVGLSMPQQGLASSSGLAESALRETTLTLPEGMQLNPSAANALQACSVADFDFLDALGQLFAGSEEEAQTANVTSPSGPPNCPDAAKLGTVSISTPLLAHELSGAVYLAAQNTDPFRSPLALYLTAEDRPDGILVKLAGEVTLNEATGQITTTFRNAPQLPFSTLTLHIFGGQRASLATPPLCGAYRAQSTFTPWSAGAPAAPDAGFAVETGAGGTPCPSSPLPFAPAFSAGVSNTQAGAYTPFTLTIGHADSDQPLQALDMHLPAGIAALISQVTPCSEAQALADACPPESRVGHTTALAGLGSEPVELSGEVYLTGALRQTATHGAAPFGLLAVTHAAAGPFDLGDVNVLSTLNVDPSTAAVTVQSEPIPRRIDGVPADLKELQVTVERPGDAPFEFNPTSCDPFTITGALTGYEGADVPLSYPFAVTNCASLPFHPTLEASTQGHASKADGTSLVVKVTSQGVGVANIAKTKLTLPVALPSRLTTIQKACPDSVFESTPADPGAACDEGSQIGEGIAHTPVLKAPLQGPAYLVSHGGAAFPDVEFVLKGEGILLVLDGLTDIRKGITTSEFNAVPDAPVESFEAILPAGPHSALAAYVHKGESYDVCGENLTMPTIITGQNGAVIEQETHINVTGCAAVKSFKAKKLTLAQQLAAALAKCRSTYKHSASKRAACERRAHASYTAKALAECRKNDKHSTGKRKACEADARKAYAAKNASR